jgi:hypothetical protein
MSDFGVLKKVNLRQIWPNEALGFTPWLAQNLSALGEALGMELELQDQEAPVGEFSLDILAHDLGRDRLVIIENQLEPTDHDHLGKLLTYAAGYDASAVVWLAREIRDEHRQALDWLNQRTDTDTEFYGVVIEVVRIDDSRPAYNFRPVAFPNEWRKTNAASAASRRTSARGEAYRVFFQKLIDELRDRHNFTRARRGQPQSWYTFASGFSKVYYGVAFAQGGRVRTEVYIDRSDSKQLFDALVKEKEVLKSEIGHQVHWERLDDKKASRIAVYRSGSIDDDSQTLEELRAWAIDQLLKFKKTFSPRFEELLR